MKKFFVIAVACVLAISAQAQIVSSHSRSITKQSNNRDYERLYISYAPVSCSGDYVDALNRESKQDLSSLNGINFGYLYGKSVSTELPLYLELGANIQYAWKSVSDSDTYSGGKYEFDATMSMLAINVPLSIAYKLPIADGVSLSPYAGIHVRGNIIGKITETGTETYKGYSEEITEEIDFFDKDDMEGSEYTANRVQIGGQIGVGLNYNSLYVGVAYTTQFGEYLKKWNTSGLQVTLGYEF